MAVGRTRQALLDTAARVLVGNRAAGLDEVAVSAGVVRTTLYRHFHSREALMRAVAMHAAERAERALLDAEVEVGPVVPALLRAAEGLISMEPQLQFLVEEATRGDEAVLSRWGQIMNQLVKLVKRGQAEGVLRPEVSSEWTVRAFVALLCVAWQGIAEGSLAPREAPGLVADTLLDGVGLRAEAAGRRGQPRRAG
jgi:AcrR family transcriptional regulator